MSTVQPENRIDCQEWNRTKLLSRSPGISKNKTAGISARYAIALKALSLGLFAANVSGSVERPQAGQKALTSGIGASQ